MAKFKAGDRVRILDGHPYVDLTNDPVGTVTYAGGKADGWRGKFVVDVDGDMRLAFKGRELELVADAAADVWTPKVGDLVRFTDACDEDWWFGPRTPHKEGVVADAGVLGSYEFAVRVPSYNNNLAFVGPDHIELMTTPEQPAASDDADRHHFKFGDRIRCVDNRGDPTNFVVGDFYTVKRVGGDRRDDLVWVNETHSAMYAYRFEPAPEPVEQSPKFKIGDRVRVTNVRAGVPDRYIGTEFTIDKDEGELDGEQSWSGRDHKSPFRYVESHLELVAAKQRPSESFIVARLTASGEPRPNVRPRVHATLGEASAEAQRLADRLGDEFAVYQRVNSRTVDAGPVPKDFKLDEAKQALRAPEKLWGSFEWLRTTQGHDFWEEQVTGLTHLGRAILKKWIAEAEASQQVAA